MKWMISACIVLVAGCASAPIPSQADHFFQAGSFALAISAYEDFLHSHPDSSERERILYHLAVASSLTTRQQDDGQSPLVDKRPTFYLKTLLDEYPETTFRHEARALLELHQGLDALRDSIGLRTRTLMRLLADTNQLQADLDRLEGEKEGAIGALDDQLSALRQKMEARNQEIAAQEQQIARLQRELEMLKKIDTGGS